jgi:hypothetical protein
MDNLILNKAIEAFEKETKIHPEFLPPTPEEKEIDGILRFTHNEVQYKFYIEAKKELRNHQLPELERLNKKFHPLIVIGEYIFPKIKEELRKQNIGYLETNGNVFMANKDLLLWLDTKKPIPTETDTKGRAFTKTGLKLVFQFLLDENIVNLTYREIADRTGVGFGNINFIIKDLKEQGFLININKDTYLLTKKKELLNKWIEAYKVKLKPTLLIGTFRFLKNEDFLNWKNIRLRNMETWWGGEPAGDQLTNFLKPAELTLYTIEKKQDIIKHYRLLPDDKGNVKVFQKFWMYDDVNIDVVPPLLVYADLITTGDRRCMETAQKIYDDLLQDKF